MSKLRYTCTCTRYLSPTRISARSTKRQCDSNLFSVYTRSAPTSPARWRSSSSNSPPSFRNSTGSETDSHDVAAASPDEMVHNGASTSAEMVHGRGTRPTKRNSFLLKLDALGEGYRDMREWTAVHAPKMDVNAVVKLISSLNIDLPKYQHYITKKVRTDSVERVRREQLNETRARLSKKLESVETGRELHDFGEAMRNTHDSIMTYYSSIDSVMSSPSNNPGVVQRITIVDSTDRKTAKPATTSLESLPKSNENKAVVPRKRVLGEESVGRAEVDKRTRGLVFALKVATTDASRLHRLEDLCLHLKQFTKYAKNVAIRERVIPHLLKLRRSKDSAICKYSLQALHLVGYVQPVKGRGIRILSIDGGGTRGLVALQMLRQLELVTGNPIHTMFDYICGVSTGALIAVLIGVYRKPVSECEELYKSFSRQMFTSNRLQGVSNLFTTHAYYDSQLWEKILQDNVGLEEFSETMMDERCPKVCVVSSIVNQRTMENFLFRNYTHAQGVQSKYDGSIKYHLWEAIRASSAAPGYYEQFKTDGLMHQDGGLLTNNPGAIAIHECKLLWPKHDLQCVISVGTGRYRSMDGPGLSYNLKDMLLKVVESATDTEAVHTILQDLLPPPTYFRFNPYLSEEFVLDEINEERWEMMSQDTLMYCRKNEAKLKQAAAQLGLAKLPHQRLAQWLRTTAIKFS